MFSRRRAQANQAATFVALLAILLILYVILLPAQTRDGLLGTGSGSDNVSEQRQVLLSYAPSNDPQAGVETTPLPVFRLRTAVEGNVLSDRSSISVARNVFDSNEEQLRFSAPPNTENVLLSFSVAEAEGSLEVLLNDELIYQQVIDRRQPEPISLPTSVLESENTLTFRLSSIGFSFWKTYNYELRNVRVTADVTSFERASQTQRFVVSDVDALQEAHLDFFVDCYDAGGRMEILHNNNLIYSGFPTCGIPLSLELAPGQMNEGQNFLVFNIESGEYLIDQAEITTVHEPEERTGTFSISNQQLNDIRSRDADVMMGIAFESAGSQGTVMLNGQPLQFRTDKQSFANAITSTVVSGENTVSLRSSSKAVTLIEVFIS